MPEGEEQQGAQGGTDAAGSDTQKPTPPWERNGEEFSAERAWTLIQNLTAERDGLKADKADIQQGQSTLMAKLAEALGVAPDKKAGPDDIVGTLQEKVSVMELDREVERLGRLHKELTDDDLDMLRTVPDPAVRVKIAERLAAAAKPNGKPKADPPSPPPTGSAPTQSGISRLRAAYAAETN